MPILFDSPAASGQYGNEVSVEAVVVVV